MEILNLIDTFSEFKEFKNIDREAMMHIIEDVFKAMLAKKYGSDEYFNIIVNIDKGVLEVYHNRIVVEDGEVEDPLSEISYSDAIKIEPDFEVGEEVSEAVDIKDFGRREILAIRQNLQTKVMEFEKENIFLKYKDKVGEIITAEVYQVWRKEILIVDEDGIELVLPKTEQIPSDNYKKGDTIRAIVKSVDNKNGSPVITLSRTSEIFLQRLFEMEVPEVYDGLITIRKIVREPGQRAKIAVESYDERIDPVGACVGMKGSRIHGIVRELRNENIDVINYTTKADLFITRALSPAKISSIVIDDTKKLAEVYMENDQVSLAIGKGGYNIKLAGKLTGYEIDVYRNTEEAEREDDVDLKEFADEIDEWIIDSLRNMGCDTAKAVLAYTADEIATRADLEIETVVEILDILKAEFDDDDQ
jgi:N utilization substance protein A